MNVSKSNNLPRFLVPAAFLFYAIVNIISWRFPFFWDTLLTSTICNYFSVNGFNGGIPNNAIDAGHPPLFYAYIFGWWQVFGKSLWISHLAMLPLLWLMIYNFIHLSANFLRNSKLIIAATVLFCLETTILAQSTLVSYDIALLCFYIVGLRYLLKRKALPVALACIGLSLISLRGCFAVFALFLTELVLFRKTLRFQQLLQHYLPAFLIFMLWNFWHINQTGWMLFTTSESWDTHRGFVNANGLMRNVAVIIRNLLEPGRLALYGSIAIGLILNRKRLFQAPMRQTVLVTFIPFIILTLFFIPFSNPIGHRYLILIFALSIILLVQLFAEHQFRKLIFAATAICFISGHFWFQFYPSSVSKGWDASLEHVTYFQLDNAMRSYLQAENIPLDAIASQFPMDVSEHQQFVNGAAARPQKFDASNLAQTEYILYSNISNDFDENSLNTIQREFVVDKQFSKNGIELILFKR